MNKTTWVPSRKWFVTQVTASAALLTMWVTTNGWEQEETLSLIGLVSQAVIAYLVPNAESGGTPPDSMRLNT